MNQVSFIAGHSRKPMTASYIQVLDYEPGIFQLRPLLETHDSKLPPGLELTLGTKQGDHLIPRRKGIAT
jgi:hypothetical protein